MKVRLRLALTVCAVMLAVPAFASAQGRAVRVAPRGAAAVRVAPRVVVRGYYAPYYYGFYDPFWYGDFGWYGWYGYGPGWYGSPYWYPPYGYQRGYYGGGASLKLEVTPKNAQVFVDGYYAGIVDDFDGIFQSLDLAPGEHDLELYLPGYRSIEQKVYLQPGKTFRVKYAMEPLRPGDPEPVRPEATAPPAPPPQSAQQPPPPPRRGGPRQPPPPGEPRGSVSAQRGYGAVAIRVQPTDAEVVIDGERWNGSQSGDRLEVQLAAGTHNVEVRKDGFRTYSTDVLVRDGQTATLNVALTRQ